jgi:putative signal transducing protein
MADDEPAESTGGSHGGWDQVAETAQIFEAELIALRLRGSGIEAEVVDQTFNQEPLPNVRSFAVVRVLVPKEKLAEARRILDHPEPLPEDGESE